MSYFRCIFSMTEPKEEEPTPFDAEWEIRKFGRRLMDIMDIIDELKSKDKSLSARISRLKLAVLEEGEEGESREEREEGPRPRLDLEDMSIEQRAILYSELVDRLNPE